MSERKLWIHAPAGGLRLDRLLLDQLKQEGMAAPSRARLKELFKLSMIRVGSRAVPPSLILPEGAHEVSIAGSERLLVPWTEARARPARQGSFLPAVYEDDQWLVLNKASGIPSAPQAEEETETAVGSALARAPGLAGVGRRGLEPGLLHRLDTLTSGLLVFAKSPAAFTALHEQWKTGRVRKIYRALAPLTQAQVAPLGQAPRSLTPLRLTLGHDIHNARRMRVIPAPGSLHVRGKPLQAETILLRGQPVPPPPLHDWEIEIKTGVMHQIRCTLAHLGAPILGDPLYGGAPSNRLWLHAWRVGLPMGAQGYLWLESALPEGWPKGG